MASLPTPISLFFISASVGCQERPLLPSQGPSIMVGSAGEKETHRCWATPKAPEGMGTHQGWRRAQHFPSWPECRWQRVGGGLSEKEET